MAHPDIELLNTVYPSVPAVDLPKSGGGLARFVDINDTQLAYGQIRNLTAAKSLTTSWQTLPLKDFIGEGCSKSNNGIKVTNSGIYVISGVVYLSMGFQVSDFVHIAAFINNSNAFESYIKMAETNAYISTFINPFIASLSANDVVTLRAYNQGGNRGTAGATVDMGLTLFQIR